MPFSDWSAEDIARFKQALDRAPPPPDDENGPYYNPLLRYAQLRVATRQWIESLNDDKVKKLEALVDLSSAKIAIIWELPVEKLRRLEGLLDLPPEKLTPLLELPVQKLTVAIELTDTMKTMGRLTTAVWKGIAAVLALLAAAATAYKVFFDGTLGGR